MILFFLLNNVVFNQKSQKFTCKPQNTWFLKNNRALSKSLCSILHYLISSTQLWKKSVHQSQFYFNHASHLNLYLTAVELAYRKNWTPILQKAFSYVGTCVYVYDLAHFGTPYMPARIRAYYQLSVYYQKAFL